MATSPAVAAKPAAAPASVPQAPADPLTGYYRAVRQMNLQLAKDRYKQGFKVRTQEYIRGRGTLAVVDEEICMGCTHCFDNCAFESIGMVDRKFALPEYSYTSRTAISIEENCVGCEKCAIVCPVDAITMVTKQGFELQDGRVVSTTRQAPPAPRPAAAHPTTARPTGSAPAPAPNRSTPVTVTLALSPLGLVVSMLPIRIKPGVCIACRSPLEPSQAICPKCGAPQM